jgi:hypothetical protein
LLRIFIESEIMDLECVVILNGRDERARLLGRIPTANGGLLACVRILSGPEAGKERLVNFTQIRCDHFEMEEVNSSD